MEYTILNFYCWTKNKITGLQNSYPLVFALLDKAETFAVQIGRPKFCIPYQLIHSCFESFDIYVF